MMQSSSGSVNATDVTPSTTPFDSAPQTSPVTWKRPGILLRKAPTGSRKLLAERKPCRRMLFVFHSITSIFVVWHIFILPLVQPHLTHQLRHMRAMRASLLGINVQKSPQKYAYVTLLCDELMAQATFVLVHSLKKTGTRHDIIVLTLHLSNETTSALHSLGATVTPIVTPVPYPFKATASRVKINKPCRYSKLLIWNMVEYTKVVYLDSDLLILSSIDDLFERRQLSAVPDSLPPDRFNSGVMVVEPNRTMFEDMMDKVSSTTSPNVGDQGFLNSYFPDWYRSPPDCHLDGSYNSMVRVSGHPPWKWFVEPWLKVVHFSGESKPWNRKIDQQFPTTRDLDSLWWDWQERAQQVVRETAAPAPVPALPPPPLCARDYMGYTRGHLDRNKLSVLINSFDRFDVLTHMIRQYAGLEFVHKIYVVWGNPNLTPFLPSVFNVNTDVEVLFSGVDSLNDRFRPIASLQTEALLVCDDDVEVDPAALRTAFESWQKNPSRLVGFFPRAHYQDPETSTLVYVLNPLHTFSLVLTKMFVMHADYLHWYTCLAPQTLRDYVDEHKNCEDIAMNFLVSHVSGQPPLLIEDGSKIDYGTSSGLSARGTHVHSRSRCLNDIHSLLGFMSLANTSETRIAFDHDWTLGRDRSIAWAPPSTRTPSHPFLPVFHPTLGPMSAVKLDKGLGHVPSKENGGNVLCIKGRNEFDSEDLSGNQYALLPFSSVHPTWTHLSGTTFVVHSSDPIDHRFSLLTQITPFVTWRAHHFCFGPSRILLYNDNRMTVQVSEWTTNVLRALLGPNARPHLPPNATASSPRSVECVENAVVARRKRGRGGVCNPMLLQMRKYVHSYCSHARPAPILDDWTANVRVALVGDPASWQSIPWVDPTRIRAIVEAECGQVTGLKCQVAEVEGPQDFCSVQVVALSRADVVIGPLGAPLMANCVFLEPHTAVLEVVAGGTRGEEAAWAKEEMECFELQYQQLFEKAGMDLLVWWVRKHVKRLAMDGRKVKKEPISLMEACVVRKMRY